MTDSSEQKAPLKVTVRQRRTNLYIHLYAILDHPARGLLIVPILQSMWSRSKYMPHMGLKERIKALKSVGLRAKIDILLEGDCDDRHS